MKDWKVREEAIKILKEKAGKNLFNLGRSNFLLNTSPEARETKTKMNSRDFIKIKSLCIMKEAINKLKDSLWNRISVKGLVSNYKELNTQKAT